MVNDLLLSLIGHPSIEHQIHQGPDVKVFNLEAWGRILSYLLLGKENHHLRPRLSGTQMVILFSCGISVVVFSHTLSLSSPRL